MWYSSRMERQDFSCATQEIKHIYTFLVIYAYFSQCLGADRIRVQVESQKSSCVYIYAQHN